MTDREILEQLLAGQQKMQSDISGLKSDVAVLKSDVAGLKSDVAGLKSDVEGLKSDVAVLKSDVAVLKSDVEGLKSDVEGLKSDVAVLKSDVEGLKSDVEGLKSDVEGLKSDVAGLQSDVAGLQSDIAELRLGQQETNARLSRLEDDVAAMKLRLENTTDKNIQIIAENYSNLVAKLDKNNAITDQQFAYQIKVNYLMDDVQMLKQDMKKLKSAVGI